MIAGAVCALGADSPETNRLAAATAPPKTPRICRASIRMNMTFRFASMMCFLTTADDQRPDILLLAIGVRAIGSIGGW